MPVFHVYLNRQKLSTAGVGDIGVLSAHVTWVRRTGQHTRTKRPGSSEEEMTLQVGGLITPTEEHVSWLSRDLAIGDEVRIKVSRDAVVDRPRSRRKRDEAMELRAEKRYVRKRAKQFGWTIKAK